MAYGGMRTYLGDQHEANEISEIQSPVQSPLHSISKLTIPRAQSVTDSSPGCSYHLKIMVEPRSPVRVYFC